MSVYSFLYYFSLGYLIIAAIAYVILMLLIFLDKKKKFFNAITTQTSSRSVQIFSAIVSPMVMALGWIFFLIGAIWKSYAQTGKRM